MILIISDHINPYNSPEVIIMSQRRVKDFSNLVGLEIHDIHFLNGDLLDRDDMTYLKSRMRNSKGSPHLKWSI
jgi:hypothetical protein